VYRPVASGRSFGAGDDLPGGADDRGVEHPATGADGDTGTGPLGLRPGVENRPGLRQFLRTRGEDGVDSGDLRRVDGGAGAESLP
jgi:hypothetical protein